MRSDRELIAQYGAGDEPAFTEFYERHRKPLYVLLLSFVGSRETAEELMQETFLAFLKSLDRIDSSDGYRPLLARAARNLAIDHLRRRRTAQKAFEKRAADPLFRPGGTNSPGGAAAPAAWEEAEALGTLLLGLPEEQREAVILKVFLGMTFLEIARVQDCPEAAAVSRYRYGIGKLRTSLAPGGCHDGAR